LSYICATPEPKLPPSAVFFYWVTRATVVACLLTAVLAAVYYGARFLLERWRRRLPPQD
jgi:hypothetical protein